MKSEQKSMAPDSLRPTELQFIGLEPPPRSLHLKVVLRRQRQPHPTGRS